MSITIDASMTMVRVKPVRVLMAMTVLYPGSLRAKAGAVCASAALAAAGPLRLVHRPVRVAQYCLRASAVVAVHLDDAHARADRHRRVGDVDRRCKPNPQPAHQIVELGAGGMPVNEKHELVAAVPSDHIGRTDGLAQARRGGVQQVVAGL